MKLCVVTSLFFPFVHDISEVLLAEYEMAQMRASWAFWFGGIRGGGGRLGWVRDVAVGWLEWLRAADERWEMAREDLMSGFAWEEEKEFWGAVVRSELEEMDGRQEREAVREDARRRLAEAMEEAGPSEPLG